LSDVNDIFQCTAAKGTEEHIERKPQVDAISWADATLKNAGVNLSVGYCTV
jgi:hypothetical protein